MEVSKKTLDILNKFVRIALENENSIELESILRGSYDVPMIRKEQYLRVFHGLKNKGYPSEEHPEILNVIISSPEKTQFRASVKGASAIQRYCMNDRLIKNNVDFLEKKV